MADSDKGPLLTSCIIFYLSIGAAIFQILEQPNWELATSEYSKDKEKILKRYACLKKEDLDYIVEVVSKAAGQGVTITGEKPFSNWDWSNSVIFAATIVTTIGYGNVAPKTAGGRVFCILYGLCGIPLCLTWISELGSFFGDRATRLSQVLIRKGQSVKKVQIICTAIFLLWGLLFHLVLPPLVFMSVEGWSYLEGLYFSFITLTTIGFGDYVAGVNPGIDYPRLYRACAELWMYMGLAWLSLFFSWNVYMVVQAHKVLRKRRHRHRLPPEENEEQAPAPRPTAIDIFKYLSERDDDDYGTVIKNIGGERKPVAAEDAAAGGRCKSCSDLLEIYALDRSPRHLRRRFSISADVFVGSGEAAGVSLEGEEEAELIQDDRRDPAVGDDGRQDGDATEEEEGKETLGAAADPASDISSDTEGVVLLPEGRGTRFTISKVVTEEKDEKG